MDEFIQCDGPRCPARSLVHVSKFEQNELELHYCGHHADEYMPKLRLWGIVTDDRLADKVVAKVAPSAAFA